MNATSKAPQARRFRISGRVQGVGFRYFARHWAQQFQLRGYVKNVPDGDVEVYAIGSAAQLEQFKEKLFRGPAMAVVTHFDDVLVAAPPECASFEIEGD